MWYCKYCKKSMNDLRKIKHQELKSHKTKARWHKYFSKLDHYMDKLKDDYKKGNLTVDDFNKIEQKIYDDFDKADDEGYFENLPDSDTEDEDENKD